MPTLRNQIFIALLAGALVGVAANLAAPPRVAAAIAALTPIGTAFIRLVTMVVIPLVVASLVTGIASLGDLGRLGRIGGRSLVLFALTSTLAATIGVGLARLADLGERAPLSLSPSLAAPDRVADARAAAADTSLVQTLIAIVPQNPLASAVQGDLLPLIVAVCLFGAALTVIGGEGRRTMVAFFEGLNDASMVVLGWIMRLAPLAVFVLTAAAIARSGVEMLASLLEYSVVVVLALAIHAVLVLMVLLRVFGGMRAGHFLRSVSDAVALAFSTAASNVALPVSMAALRNRLGVPNDIVAFVLPAGTTLNKNGSAVYKAVTAVFVAELFGVHLDSRGLIVIVLTSVLAAAAGAGVPASSLVTTLIVLNAAGLGPNAAAGIALVAGIDRPLDMCRTAVNTLGNLVVAVVVARGERAIAPQAVAADSA
jgi:DAACS family dicarboxylate/amino acid:cation (Na+ or H+) symporter